MQVDASSIVRMCLFLLQPASFPGCCLLLLQKQVATAGDPKVSHKANGWYRMSGYEKGFLAHMQRYHQIHAAKMTRKQGWYSSIKVFFLPADIINDINALCAHMVHPTILRHSAKAEQGILWFRS